MKRIHLLACCITLLGAAAGVALDSTPAQAQTRVQRQAAEVAGRAREAFSEERYEEAAQLLQDAYNIFPEPNFIWNQARAWELAGRFTEAEDAYLRFANLDVGDEERAAALDRAARFRAAVQLPRLVRDAQQGAELDVLRKSVKSLRESGAQAQTAEPSGGPDLLELGGWGLTGLGVLAFGAAGTLHLASIGTVEEYQDAAARGETNKYNALKDTLNTRVTTSQVLLGGGTLLLAGGATLLYLTYFHDDAPPAQAEVQWTPILVDQGAGLGLSGSF